MCEILGLFNGKNGLMRHKEQIHILYIGMSGKYQVKCIYEVYSPYRIKICVHLAYLSFTLGVPDTLISNIYAIWL